jgi:glycosyltransferase involved in cell wall biosynthesis
MYFGENNSFAERKAITFVGGFAHLPIVDGIQWFVREVLPLIAREIPAITIIIIGSNPPPEIVNLSNEQIRVTGYISNEALHAYYSTTKVVVAPIRFGAEVKSTSFRFSDIWFAFLRIIYWER